MATTTAFGWSTPDDTSLVKDGAAAIRTLGQSIDTSMAELKGGTTGQVLSKTSNTDMDFTWVAQDDSNAIQNAIVDAKGDLIAATAADTPARLAVGSDYAILQALASETTGLIWGSKVTAYTPTWGVVSGTTPTIGNGLLEGRTVRVGDLVYFRLKVVIGSTTTIGSGTYTFSLPFAMTDPVNGFVGNAAALDAGVAWYRGYYPNSVENGFTDKIVLVNNSGNTIQNSVPFTFGTNDQILMWGVYNV